MRKVKFSDEMKKFQVSWRRRALSNQTAGLQNKRAYDHILPRQCWELNLWPGIRSDSQKPLLSYLRKNAIQRHTGSHNLCSSWTMCANLYFPFREEPGRSLLTGFLSQYISKDIEAVTRVELEYQNTQVPPTVLGESDGHRGSGQTSPDVAFEITTSRGEGVVLVESKFTEHSFYACSGRRHSGSSSRPPNPDSSRCLRFGEVLADPVKACHLSSWNRRYWDFLKPVANIKAGEILRSCPAAFGGYQLMRQQALAEAIAMYGKDSLVISTVAYDDRNAGLMKCMARSTNLTDIRTVWPTLFNGRAGFKVFSHQAWVAWVADHDKAGNWTDWIGYVRDRYGL